jgi:uncharacterized protein involved in oxidation of intracellular sulfur
VSTTLVIVNDPPYGTERAYNALRLARAILEREGESVQIFLIGDGASNAKRGQKVPHGYYNIETMLDAVVKRGALIGVCSSCMDARGMEDGELMEGCHRSSMSELAEWTATASRVLSF